MRINFIVQKNEASTLTRGGHPTKLFDVVELILKNGGSVRGKDLKPLFPQLPALYSLLKSEPGIIRDTAGAFPTLSVSDDLYQRYVASCKEMNRPYYDQKGVQQGAPAKQATGAVMPFEQCFFASMILDAKDYSGGRECSWIDPKKLNHVLATYEDDDGTLLSRKMGDLKQKYDLLKEKCLADGKSKVIRVGKDYGTIDPESIPGIEDYLEMWPKHSPDGRVQQATSLWMCVAPSRDKVKFDSNEWNRLPVIDV